MVAYYRKKGVVVHLDESVGAIEQRDGRFVVHGARAGPLTADAVIAGIGIVPTTELAGQAGLPWTTASSWMSSFAPAARDLCGRRRRPLHNPALGKHMRVEHEDNANTMGRIAGLNMAGAGLSYDHLPFFYSDLFDRGYEAVGELDARLETVADWKEEFKEGVVYYLGGGRVRGVLLWNTWGQVDAARALIAEPGPIRPAQLKGRLPA